MRVFQRLSPGSRAALLSAAAGAAFLVLVQRYVVDFPNADDFGIFLAYRMEAHGAATTSEWLSALVRPHNEHRPIVARLAATAIERACGRLRFDVLVISGCAAVPVLVLLLLRFLDPVTPMSAAPLALLLLNPAYAEAALWSSGGWPWLWVHAFAVAAFLLHEARRLAVVAVAAAAVVAAAGSRGDGFLAGGAIAVTLLLRRRWCAAASFSLLTVVLAVAASAAGGAAPHAAWPSLRTTWFSVALLGGALGLGNGVASAVTGGLVAAVLVWLVLRCRPPGPAMALGLFVLASAVLVGIARGPGNPELAFRTGRYRILSLVAVAACYVMAHAGARTRGERRRVEVAALALAAVTCAASFAFRMDEMRLRRDILADAALRWQLFGAGLPHPDDARASATLRACIERGIYVPPPIDPPVASEIHVDGDVPGENGSLGLHVQWARASPGWVLIEGHASWPRSLGATRLSLALATPRRWIRVEAATRTRPDADARDVLAGPRDGARGFHALVPRRILGRRRYAVAVVLERGASSSRSASVPIVLDVLEPSVDR